MRVLYPAGTSIGIWRFRVSGGRKTGESRQKPLKRGVNQKQSEATQDTRPELNLRHIGVRRALSPLCFPCSPILIANV